MFIIFSLVYLFYIITDLVPLYINKKTKEFWIYLIFLSLAYGYCVLLAFGIRPPSPTGPIKKIIEAMTGQ